ncbi:hypothetical protein [Paenibacillus sp. KS-LC4]|uniref:hypothetical protein n=1 Tax=Paenibacillus sp. KS-LC4 TaxID=2979727 RepID=UPI0030CE7510
MKKKLIYSSVILVFVFLFLFVQHLEKHAENSFLTEIEVEDIPEVLQIKEVPQLPNWKIEKIQKFDDGFTHPYPIIFFENGIQLHLTINEQLYNLKSKESILIGIRKAVLYKDNDNRIYSFGFSNLYYAFILNSNDQSSLVENYIVETH